MDLKNFLEPNPLTEITLAFREGRPININQNDLLYIPEGDETRAAVLRIGEIGGTIVASAGVLLPYPHGDYEVLAATRTLPISGQFYVGQHAIDELKSRGYTV